MSNDTVTKLANHTNNSKFSTQKQCLYSVQLKIKVWIHICASEIMLIRIIQATLRQLMNINGNDSCINSSGSREVINCAPCKISIA